MADVKSCSILLALPFALCGCSSAAERVTTELISPPPQNYREIVATRGRANFPDPHAIRDTSISAPFVGASLLGSVSIVCVRANGRDEKTGAFTERKVASFTFRNGELGLIEKAYAPITCANAVYEPFPELEQDYTAPPPAVTSPPRRAKRTKT